MQNPFLIGEQVYLRPFDTSDAPRLLAYMNDREVTRTLGRTGPFSLEQEHEFIRTSISDTKVQLAIVLRDGDELIGGTGFNTIDHLHRWASFGIVVGQKQHWGRGIGTEVTRLCCEYGFVDLNLNRIELEVDADNIGGRTAYTRAGFVEEGVRREARLREGEPIDVVTMGLLRAEWLSSRDD